MAVGSRAMDRMNRVRPPTGPYGPWTVARWTGTPSSGPVHGPGVVRVAVPAWAFAWTTYLVGPPNGPWSVRVVRGTIPCTVHSPSGWSAMPALTWAFAWAA